MLPTSIVANRVALMHHRRNTNRIHNQSCQFRHHKRTNASSSSSSSSAYEHGEPLQALGVIDRARRQPPQRQRPVPTHRRRRRDIVCLAHRADQKVIFDFFLKKSVTCSAISMQR
jgi:hypothetical protein